MCIPTVFEPFLITGRYNSERLIKNIHLTITKFHIIMRRFIHKFGDWYRRSAALIYHI